MPDCSLSVVARCQLDAGGQHSSTCTPRFLLLRELVEPFVAGADGGLRRGDFSAADRARPSILDDGARGAEAEDARLEDPRLIPAPSSRLSSLFT